MPICTSCTHPIPFLYTVYESAYNLRLEQCPACGAFADPYVEHDALTLLIDLILLKRDVYRHLLFNRGLGARKAGGADDEAEEESAGLKAEEEASRERARWYLIAKLGIVLVGVDAFIRWTYLGYSMKGPGSSDPAEVAQWSQEAMDAFLWTFVGCLFETIAFHTGIVCASFVVLTALRRLRSPSAPVSGVHQVFRYSHIPLTLLYSSLTKLFLLLLLSIWRPAPASASAAPWYATAAPDTLLRFWDEDALDREWVVRNVLGGMAAGFGLRVALACAPLPTTLVILAGWAAKTAAAGAWGGPGAAEWMAYSIP